MHSGCCRLEYRPAFPSRGTLQYHLPYNNGVRSPSITSRMQQMSKVCGRHRTISTEFYARSLQQVSKRGRRPALDELFGEHGGLRIDSDLRDQAFVRKNLPELFGFLWYKRTKNELCEPAHGIADSMGFRLLLLLLRSICDDRRPNLTVTKEIGDQPAGFPAACRPPSWLGVSTFVVVPASRSWYAKRLCPMLQIVHWSKGLGHEFVIW